MRKSFTLAALAALTLASALAAPVAQAAKGGSNGCSGTFVQRSCKLGGDGKDCYYPYEKGQREEFMGWDIEDGVRGYVVYRLGAYPASDIKLDPGCRLPKY